MLQFIPDRSIHETYQVSFIVEASDPNGTVPVLSAERLPSGADFIDRGGIGVFDWMPEVGQAGVYDGLCTASDGELEASQLARIIVCAGNDSDCDGMDDDWEMAHFGTLSRDGSGDYEDDGASDLDELDDGTDPLTPDVKLRLRAGLNLISFPIDFDPARTAADLLTELGAGAVSMARLNATGDVYETFTLEEGDGQDLDFPVSLGEGYVLRMVEPLEHIWTGEVAPTDTAMAGGLSLKGFNTIPVGFGSHDLLMAIGDADTARAIRRFDSDTGRFESAAYYLGVPVGSDFPIRRGEAYLIHLLAPATDVQLP